jgi:hypothetical protein
LWIFRHLPPTNRRRDLKKTLGIDMIEAVYRLL